MKTLLGILLSSILTLTSLCFAETIPAEDFFKRGTYRNLTISPDGSYYATLYDKNGKTMLVFLDRKTGDVTGGVTPGENNVVHSYTWVNNNRVTYEFAEMRQERDSPVSTGELFAIDVDNGNNRLIFGFRAGDERTGARLSRTEDTMATQEVISLLKDDDKHILIAEYPWDQSGHYWYDKRNKNTIISKLNVYSGIKKNVETLPYKGANPIATSDGTVNFIHWHNEEGYSRGAYRTAIGEPWIEIDKAFDLGNFAAPIAAHNNGRLAYVNAYIGEQDLHTIYEIDPVNKTRVPIFTGNTTDIESWTLDIDSNAPVVGTSHPDKVQYHYVEGESRVVQWHKMLATAFKGSKVKITNWTEDGKEIVAFVHSDINPGEYYLFNTETKKADFILANLAWLDPRKLQAMTPLKITARDNTTLQAYLTLPKNKHAPLIVMPHGGPHVVRDYWTFDEHVQFFANRGFAVLQVNFRGSGGYGETFHREGYRQWGGKMIDDIIDATQTVIKEGRVDGDNVCIYGASYGGYAAMMSAYKAPELFDCAAGFAGVYNLEYMYSKGDIIKHLWGGEAYLKRTLGDDIEQLKAFSPVNHADKIKAEIMLAHGEEDNRVPIAHAKDMRKAFENAGKKVKWLEFGRAGHGIWDEKDQVTLQTELVKFFETSMKLKTSVANN